MHHFQAVYVHPGKLFILVQYLRYTKLTDLSNNTMNLMTIVLCNTWKQSSDTRVTFTRQALFFPGNAKHYRYSSWICTATQLRGQIKLKQRRNKQNQATLPLSMRSGLSENNFRQSNQKRLQSDQEPRRCSVDAVFLSMCPLPSGVPRRDNK